MELTKPKCKVCETRRWTKRVRDDWFRCTNCGSIWEHKGFTEQERLARFCPICDTYVEYENWQPYFPYGVFSYWEREILKNFHYECHEKHVVDVAEQKAELDRQIERAEKISQLVCPNCQTQNICWEDENFYYCMQCDVEYSEEWINEKLKEMEHDTVK